MERGHGISDAPDGERGLEGCEDFLEEIVAHVDSRFHRGCHVVRAVLLRSIVSREGTREMYPIDSPRFIIGRAVGVGQAGRKNEILIAHYVKATSVDFIPTLPIYTIDENVLMDRCLSASEVMLRVGIVAYVGDVDQRSERVTENEIGDSFREHERALPFESVF